MGCGVSKKLSVRYLPGIMIVNFYTHRRLWLFSNGMFWGDLFHWNRLEWMNGMNKIEMGEVFLFLYLHCDLVLKTGHLKKQLPLSRCRLAQCRGSPSLTRGMCPEPRISPAWGPRSFHSLPGHALSLDLWGCFFSPSSPVYTDAFKWVYWFS